MELIYSCTDCGAEMLFKDLKVHIGSDIVWLRCPNEDCDGEAFIVYIK